MRVIIAGSRSLLPQSLSPEPYRVALERVLRAIDACVDSFGVWPTQVLSGCAEGVDQVGEIWARQHNIEIYLFPADWDKHGKSAGMIRNREMSREADALVLVWDGTSRGSSNMKSVAAAAGLAVAALVLPPLP